MTERDSGKVTVAVVLYVVRNQEANEHSRVTAQGKELQIYASVSTSLYQRTKHTRFYRWHETDGHGQWTYPNWQEETQWGPEGKQDEKGERNKNENMEIKNKTLYWCGNNKGDDVYYDDDDIRWRNAGRWSK